MVQVQVGVGRTGKWWGHQHVSGKAIELDIMIFAKGIASGFPFAGLATREHLFEGLATGTMGGTYGESLLFTSPLYMPQGWESYCPDGALRMPTYLHSTSLFNSGAWSDCLERMQILLQSAEHQ